MRFRANKEPSFSAKRKPVEFRYLKRPSRDLLKGHLKDLMGFL